MKARLTWNDERAGLGSRRTRSGRAGLRALEWTFLLVGLLAVDCFVWMNTSSVLYQAYEDWAFDQTLRGLTPGVGGFMGDEARWLFSGGREKAQTAETPKLPAGGKRSAHRVKCGSAGQAFGDRTACNSTTEHGGDGAGRRGRRHVEPGSGAHSRNGAAGQHRQRWTGGASRYVFPSAAEHSRRRHH